MDVDEHHIGIRPEDVLGAVAMVGVPIQDHHPFTPQFAAGMGSGHCHIVEQAESPRPDRLGMMARRPDQGKGMAVTPCNHRFHCGDCRAGGDFRGHDAALGNRRGVHIQPGVLVTQVLNEIKIAGCVNPTQFLAGGGPARLHGEPGNRLGREQVHHRAQASGMLRVFPLRVEPRKNLADTPVKATGQEGNVHIRLMRQHAVVVEQGNTAIRHDNLHIRAASPSRRVLITILPRGPQASAMEVGAYQPQTVVLTRRLRQFPSTP